jgi:cell division protein FtsW
MNTEINLYLQGMLNGESRQSSKAWPMDYWLVGSSLALIILGLIMVGSASVSVAEKQAGNAFYFLWRQLLYTGIGVFIALIITRIPLRTWQSLGPWLIAVSLILLLLVFIPGLGRTVNGSARWISVAGFNMQPSEVVKLFAVIYLAGYLVRQQHAIKTSLGGFLRPLALFVILVLFLLLEPDFGAAAVILTTAVMMMWLGGVRVTQFAVLVVSVAGVLFVLALISPYRLQRMTAFMNPWADPFDSGFQLTQALIAFGRGEWFGVGLGSSVQKLFYLPEAHTDFLFAVLAEELGLVGVVIVMLLFTILVLRALHIGRSAEKRERPFAGFIAYGLGIWIGLQAFINIGVNMGVLPTKGLTLPFMSYGGSSIVVMCTALGLLLRVDYETRRDDRNTQRSKHPVW